MSRALKDKEEFAGKEGEKHILGRVGSMWAGEKVSVVGRQEAGDRRCGWRLDDRRP